PPPPHLKRLRPRLPRRSGGPQHHQDPPPLRQAVLPDLSRFRNRSAPGLAALRPTIASYARVGLLRLRRKRQSAHPAPQGSIPSSRSSSARQIRPPHPAERTGRPARRHPHNRHALPPP